ncbi:MAG: hypothetical protein HQL27_00325 [Candidatus Omnitrophica bacterium]|nr:hypothetical protein [Candidatus Omnitrophota bacterium]
MIVNREKCLNPWVGFLIIFTVCVIISTAIFYEFRNNPGQGRKHKRATSHTSATPIAYPVPGAEMPVEAGKFTF